MWIGLAWTAITGGTAVPGPDGRVSWIFLRKGYECLAKLAPEKPFMIAETGCTEEGGDKGKWIEDGWETLKNRFPRIKALIWFNVNKECDWRVDSSPESADSFKKCWGRP